MARATEQAWPEEQSKIWKRNATAADLALAQKEVGKTIQFKRAFGDQPPPYRIVDVRLDSLNRLIADLVLTQAVQPVQAPKAL